ncbi:MAG: hypothetical protein H0T65_10875, partial [Deltaproteobacteria bacterium]|nr:hypothetical protein [Deltaproteobacteria bacterium]
MKWIGLCALALGCGSSSKATPTNEPTETTPLTKSVAEPTPTRAPVEPTRSAGGGNRCSGIPAAEISVDGMLDDWRDTNAVARVGAEGDGAISVRCAWDGSTLAFAIDVKDDRVIRVKGGSEDHVTLSVSAGGKPVTVVAFPGNNLGKSKIVKPARVQAADSLQPKGFSVEIAIPGSAIPNMAVATASLDLHVVFSDSDAATGGDTQPLEIKQAIELSDRKDLFDDFLASVKLSKADIRVDIQAELDPDRKGKERLVAGGTAIGVITDQFAFVTLPAASAADVKKVELMPLGPRGQQVVAALVRQAGNGGSRELLMLWTVWSGQLQPLAQIEVKKEMDGKILEATWRIVKGKKAPELWLEPKPAVGWTAETWNEEPAPDLDPILLPWD